MVGTLPNSSEYLMCVVDKPNDATIMDDLRNYGKVEVIYNNPDNPGKSYFITPFNGSDFFAKEHFNKIEEDSGAKFTVTRVACEEYERLKTFQDLYPKLEIDLTTYDIFPHEVPRTGTYRGYPSSHNVGPAYEFINNNFGPGVIFTTKDLSDAYSQANNYDYLRSKFNSVMIGLHNRNAVSRGDIISSMESPDFDNQRVYWQTINGHWKSQIDELNMSLEDSDELRWKDPKKYDEELKRDLKGI